MRGQEWRAAPFLTSVRIEGAVCLLGAWGYWPCLQGSREAWRHAASDRPARPDGDVPTWEGARGLTMEGVKHSFTS